MHLNFTGAAAAIAIDEVPVITCIDAVEITSDKWAVALHSLAIAAYFSTDVWLVAIGVQHADVTQEERFNHTILIAAVPVEVVAIVAPFVTRHAYTVTTNGQTHVIGAIEIVFDLTFVATTVIIIRVSVVTFFIADDQAITTDGAQHIISHFFPPQLDAAFW
jgi:hypothetical protein